MTRVVKMLGELWRHAKAIGVTGGGQELLGEAGVPTTGTGVVTGGAGAVAAGLLDLLAGHRVWDRFPPVSTTGG